MRLRKLRLLLATKNKGKLIEVQDALRGLPLILETLVQYPDLPDAVEDGPTFAANAKLKSEHYRRLTGLATLADDSGLAVEMLDGAPGIHSARLAPSDDARIRKLLLMLDQVDPDWTNLGARARFVCALCLSRPGGQIEVEGEVWGQIIPTPRGDGGFGYDPVFYYPPSGKTFAELTLVEKNRVSHRAKALEAMRSSLGSCPG